MCTKKHPPPQRRKIKPGQVQRVTSAQDKKETTLALPNKIVQQTTLSINNMSKRSQRAHNYLAQVATDDKYSLPEVENFLNNTTSDDSTHNLDKRGH